MVVPRILVPLVEVRTFVPQQNKAAGCRFGISLDMRHKRMIREKPIFGRIALNKLHEISDGGASNL